MRIEGVFCVFLLMSWAGRGDSLERKREREAESSYTRKAVREREAILG